MDVGEEAGWGRVSPPAEATHSTPPLTDLMGGYLPPHLGAPREHQVSGAVGRGHTLRRHPAQVTCTHGRRGAAQGGGYTHTGGGERGGTGDAPIRAAATHGKDHEPSSSQSRTARSQSAIRMPAVLFRTQCRHIPFCVASFYTTTYEHTRQHTHAPVSNQPPPARNALALAAGSCQ